MAKEETTLQLNNSNILFKAREKADEYLSRERAPEAKKLAGRIEAGLQAAPDLASSQPDLYRGYLRVILKLKLVAFSVYDNNTSLALIKNHFLSAAKLGIDLNETIDLKMYSLPAAAWDNFSQNCIRALKENQQRLGSKDIIIQGENNPVSPTISNWLRDYDRTFGSDKQSDINQRKYLSQNPNVKKLNDQEKNWLLNLLTFYDNLKPLPRNELSKIKLLEKESIQTPEKEKPQLKNDSPEIKTSPQPPLPKKEKTSSTEENDDFPNIIDLKNKK